MSALRSALEWVTHGLLIKRRLPQSFGRVPLLVSTEGGLKFLRLSLGSVDPELLRMAGELVRPGDVVWDVGANLGLFAFAAAARAGPKGSVYAIEPDTWLVEVLRRSAKLKAPGRAPVNVLPAAVSDAVGACRFHVSRRARAASYLDSCGPSLEGGVRETQWVVTLTLDTILEHYPAPNVLKIDAEGAERRVLMGASKLLSMVRPLILCEVTAANTHEVSGILHSFGYTLVDASASPSKREPVELAAFSTLAYPSGSPPFAAAGEAAQPGAR